MISFRWRSGLTDERVLAKMRDMVLPAIERRELIQAWIIR
jgi:hypothetical protein